MGPGEHENTFGLRLTRRKRRICRKECAILPILEALLTKKGASYGKMLHNMIDRTPKKKIFILCKIFCIAYIVGIS